MKKYAGVGSRETPTDILEEFEKIAEFLTGLGYELRSGGAIGADSAFESGAKKANGSMSIYRPTHDRVNGVVGTVKQFEAAIKLVAPLHPVWGRLSTYVRKLMARNAFQVLGPNLSDPSDFVICWTPDGAEKTSETSRETGGTGMAIKIADRYNIPVFNFYNKNARTRLIAFLKTITGDTKLKIKIPEKPYDEVIDLLKSEFNDDLRVIPQNMRKESVPARMLRTLGYPAESLCWIMRDRGEYVGFAFTKELAAAPAFKDWMKSKKVKELAKTKKYIVVLFEEFL